MSPRDWSDATRSSRRLKIVNSGALRREIADAHLQWAHQMTVARLHLFPWIFIR